MRNTFLIIIGLIFLIFWLIVGYPLEINNLTADRILMVLVSVIVITIIFVIYKNVRRLKNRTIKIVLLIPLIIITVIFTWIGLWTYMIRHDRGPIWKDRQIYTNQKGIKVISQFRETSGSIYDFRERLVFHEFSNGNRISIEWRKKRMHKTWNVIDYAKDSTYIENFDELNHQLEN